MDRVWKALADSKRRAILDALSDGPKTTGQIVEAFPELSRTGVMKHLDVLEAANLVLVKREGRVRWNSLNPFPIQRIYDRWVAKHIQGISSAASRLKDRVESQNRGKDPKKRSKK